MNMKTWLFEDATTLKKAFVAMKELFYEEQEDGEWADIAYCYENTLLELMDKEPTSVYEHARLQIQPESLGEEVYCEVYATENDVRFGIDFIPWADVLGMSVDDLMAHDLPKHEILAHFLLELTFDGFSEKEMEENREELMERLSQEVESYPLTLDELFKLMD